LGYPLALLEVHVFVHVVCALMMYAIWFKKPVDIRHAVDVTDQIPEHLRTISFSNQLRVNNIEARNERLSGSRFEWVMVLFGSLILMNAAYGGVHLSTWNFDFPTGIERLLWKSSCIMTLSGSLVAPGYITWGESIIGQSIFEGTLRVFKLWRSPDSVAHFIMGIIAGIAILASPFLLAARIFLVVESFISLRDVPTGVYATVPWAQYIPHI
jgi:hypothetical protein